MYKRYINSIIIIKMMLIWEAELYEVRIGIPGIHINQLVR